MEIYNKFFVMFYRGKDDSNKVSSATKTTLDNENLSKYIPVEFINLDKRNFEKYLRKSEQLPNVIYIWHDEEIIIDYIKLKYPNIELRIYSLESAFELKDDSNYNYQKKSKYVIANNIINEYKESQGTIQLWIFVKDEIKQITINNYDYERLSDWNKEKYFSSEIAVNNNIKKQLEDTLKESEDMIKHYEKKIKDTKKKLKNQLKNMSDISKDKK